ncbi:MAG: hypothetical protein ACRELV_09130 [Longimicrobiales bacterium]
MAEQGVGGRSGTTVALIGVTIVAIIVLMWWLAATSEPSSVAIVEPDTAGAALEEEGMPPATVVDATQFAADYDSYAGQRIRLESLEVVGRVGDQLLWLQLPSAVPYLVRLDTIAADQAADLQTGDRLTAVGTVRMRSDSVLSAWVEQGVITEGQAAEASFATSYLHASRVQVSRGDQTG